MPGFATPHVEIPVDVEILVPTNARENLRLTAQVSLNLLQPGAWIEHREGCLQPFYRIEHFDQFIRGKIYQRRSVAIRERTRAEGFTARVGEGNGLKSETTQRFRQLFELEQSVDGNRSDAEDLIVRGPLQALLDPGG